jgi:hypothetical protein
MNKSKRALARAFLVHLERAAEAALVPETFYKYIQTILQTHDQACYRTGEHRPYVNR